MSVLKRKKVLCFWEVLDRRQNFRGKRKGEAVSKVREGVAWHRQKKRRL